MVNFDLNFTVRDDVEIHSGCGVTLNGQLWYLGGSSTESQQVSEINTKKASDMFSGKQIGWM